MGTQMAKKLKRKTNRDSKPQLLYSKQMSMQIAPNVVHVLRGGLTIWKLGHCPGAQGQ
ncbi:unnamed protein product [Staurois parvus]|uniref:Uncharacterized protein n=1 Tax=Staurois parvus TaxID=386267 RepID=A0ABN9C114_9NEOB|nr:unnamed protein product [Staurois parvus]